MLKSVRALAGAGLLFALLAAAGAAKAAEPMRIGLTVSMTGGAAATGKQVLVAMQIWRDDVNARGGLLGRPVELVFYDDQSTPANVPGLYTKLIDVDKVDLTVGPYGTNMVVPALPVLIAKNRATIGILALGANRQFKYNRYFAMISSGPDPRITFSEGFMTLAKQQNPAPKTIAIVGADAEFAQVSTDGARENAKKAGFQIVYDRAYPPNTTDFAPIIRAVQATNPDIVYVAAYPADTVGIVRSAGELGLKTKMFGGNMIGLLATQLRMQMGPLLNGIISTADVFIPAPSFNFPGSQELLQKYQSRAPAENVDPLGYNFAPFGYAAMQALAAAVEGTKSTDADKIADYLHKTTLKTVVGDVTFGPEGEWTKARVLVSQFQNVTGNDAEQWRQLGKQVILWPPEYKSGNMIYPYTDAKK